jgi:FkbM family methyltransferase
VSFKSQIKALIARVGYHVVRNYQNPLRTLMGLKRYRIRTVLDVGANSGQFARYIRAHIPDAEIYCFEPVPTAFVELSAWARSRRGVFPVQIALGDRSGSAQMRFHTEHSPSSSLLDTTDLCKSLYPFSANHEILTVRLERLDDYLAELGHPLKDDLLLKLDVQGFEAAVLRGAPITISKVRACIAEVSVDTLYLGQSDFPEIVSCMTAAGLHYAGNLDQAYDNDGHVVSLDALFLRDENTRGSD